MPEWYYPPPLPLQQIGFLQNYLGHLTWFVLSKDQNWWSIITSHYHTIKRVFETGKCCHIPYTLQLGFTNSQTIFSFSLFHTFPWLCDIFLINSPTISHFRHHKISLTFPCLPCLAQLGGHPALIFHQVSFVLKIFILHDPLRYHLRLLIHSGSLNISSKW